MLLFLGGVVWGCLCTCLGALLAFSGSRWALWWRVGRLLLPGAVLGLCGSAWAQHGSYPDGSPWAEVTSPSGYLEGPGQYNSATPPYPHISHRLMGDGRDGMYNLSNCFDFVGQAPLNPPDNGSATLEVYIKNLWNGDNVTNQILYQQTENARYDTGSQCWKPSAPLGVTYDVTLASGRFPPGYYETRASHVDSRGGGQLGKYSGWWCPRLLHIRVYVQLDGKPLKEFSVDPRAICPAMSSYPVKAWQRGVTDVSGYVDLLVPAGIRLCVVVPADSRYQSGVSSGYWDVPVDDSLPNGFTGGPTGEIVKEFVLTLSPSAPPAFGEKSDTNSAENFTGFWNSLWVPDKEKLEQFQAHRQFWGEWGPFGLVNGFITVWGTVTFPSDDSKYNGLVWGFSGVLGQSSLDFRPLRQSGPAYEDGGRGSLGGNVLAVVRVLVGLLVWAAAVFGVYKYLSPKWKA